MAPASMTASPVPLRTRVFPPSVLAFAPLVVALLLWTISLPEIDPDRMTDLGLVSVLPASFVLALAALILGFCLTLARGGELGWVPAAYIGAWIVAIHATPAIVYGSLRYAWAWKHVGIVEYIQRTERIDPTIESLPVYHNWPGFFGAATLLAEAAGFTDALVLANWAPVAFELLFAAGVLLILRAVTPDSRLVWLGVWFFTLTNWVGQDYFAPQAMAFVFYLVVVGICLWALSERTIFASTVVGHWLTRWAPLARLLAEVDRRISKAQAAGASLPSVSARQRRGLLAIVILLFAAIAVSHQLTPIVTIFALIGLVVFGQCRARGLPLIVALFTAAWFVTGASDMAAFGINEIVSSFGRTDENIGANLIDASLFTPGFRIVSNMARGVTAAVGLLAALGWLRRLWQGYLDLPLTLLWLAPLGLLGVSSYGGEILFRVYFFALPFMAFFVAALFAPRLETGSAWRSMAMVAITSALLASGFLVAYYGHERSNYFRPGEAAAAEYLDEAAPVGSLIVEASPNYPSRYHRYEQMVYVPLVAWPRGNVEESRNAYSLDDIVAMMSDPSYPAAYLIATDSQLLELSRPGLVSVEAIVREIDASELFQVLYHNDDATIYGLTARAPEAGP